MGHVANAKAEERGMGVREMRPGGNKSKFLPNDLAGNDKSISFVPPHSAGRARGEKSFLITERCQSAVGEDDEIIKHFPCVFFISTVVFFFPVLGKQNRSPAAAGSAAAPPRGTAAALMGGCAWWNGF